jgi:methionyl-tRNA synthetase
VIWRTGDFEIHHIIGKDIMYFHTLFWPAMLMASGFKLPTAIHIHGFLTINGEKMSKSRGTFIKARDYLSSLDPEYLRYYYASKLSSSIDDIDINWEDFALKVNSDVVNKVINIASRLGAVVNKKLGGKLTQPDEEGNRLINQIQSGAGAVKEAYENFEFKQAMKMISGFADEANKYIDTKAPWDAVKTDPEKAAQICTSGLNAFRLIMVYLRPVLPRITAGAEKYLNIKPLSWSDITTTITNHSINPYEHLAKRLDPKQIIFK